MDVLKRRNNSVEIEIFIDVEPDPSIQTVNKGLADMNTFGPDNIIAIGGGSPIDAAKIMWLLYEHPEADPDDGLEGDRGRDAVAGNDEEAPAEEKKTSSKKSKK